MTLSLINVPTAWIMDRIKYKLRNSFYRLVSFDDLIKSTIMESIPYAYNNGSYKGKFDKRTIEKDTEELYNVIQVELWEAMVDLDITTLTREDEIGVVEYAIRNKCAAYDLDRKYMLYNPITYVPTH